MPNVLSDILKLVNGRAVSKQIALFALKTFSEDISQEFSDETEDDRKSQLRKAFTNRIEEILKLFYQLCEVHFQAAQKNPNETSNITILTDILQTLISFSDKLTVTQIISHKFHIVWCHLAYIRETRMLAVDCLFLLCEKKFGGKDTFVELWKYFGKLCFTSITAKGDLTKDYEFHKHLCSTLCALGSKNVPILKIDDEEILDSYYNMILEFGKHPSIRIFDNTLRIWHKVLSEPENPILKIKSFTKIGNNLFGIISNKMLREVSNPENQYFKNHAANKFTQIDFDEIDEYRLLFTSLRTGIAHLYDLLTKLLPEQSFEFSVKAVGAVLNKNKSDQNENNVNGLCTTSSMTLILWESATMLFDWAMTSLLKNHPKIFEEKKSMEMLEQLLKMCLEFNTTDPLIEEQYLSVFKSFNGLFYHNKKALDIVIEHLFKHMKFLLKGESLYQKSQETNEARRKAFSTFIHICKDQSKYLLPSLKVFVDKTHELSSKGEITDQETTLLYEALIVISADMKSFDEKVAFLGYLLDNNIKIWKMQHVIEVLSTETLLLKAFNLIDEQNQKTKEALLDVKRKIYFCVNLFQSSIKRMECDPKKAGYEQFENVYKYPIAKYLPEILPNVFTLIKTIHSLFTPKIMSIIPKERIQGLNIGFNEGLSQVNKNSRNLSPLEKELNTISNSLKQLIVWCYNILGYSYKYGDITIWKDSNLLNTLGSSIFSNLDVLNNNLVFHILHHFVRPIVFACPSKLIYSIACEILKQYYLFLYKRLSEGWTDVIKINNGDFSVQISEIQVMAQEKILRDLTREAIDIPFNITQCLKVTKNQPYPQPSQLCSDMIKSQAGEIIVLVAIQALTLPDSITSTNATLFLIQILTQLMKYEKYNTVIAGELIQTCIRALMCQKEESHPNLIQLLTNAYSYYFLKSDLPSKIFKAIPDISDNQMKQLHGQLKKGTAEKERKKIFTTLLKPILGKNNGEFKKPKTIVNINSKDSMDLQKKKEKEKSMLDVATTDLSNLFNDDE